MKRVKLLRLRTETSVVACECNSAFIFFFAKLEFSPPRMSATAERTCAEEKKLNMNLILYFSKSLNI